MTGVDASSGETGCRGRTARGVSRDCCGGGCGGCGDDCSGGSGAGEDGGGPRNLADIVDAVAVDVGIFSELAGAVREEITLIASFVRAIGESCIAKHSRLSASRSCSTPAKSDSSEEILLVNSLIFRTDSSLPL